MPIIETNGIKMFYEERGSGPPLLLIMGITAPGSTWEKHAEYWEKDFRCIMVDNRGVGFSDKPAGPYTTAQMADDCAGLLEALQINEVKVAGVSMGSTIAQQLAIRHPRKVQSLVLMSTWARCDHFTKGLFLHMITCKARLTPVEFALFIQLLIYSKSFWDRDGMAAELEEARRTAAVEQQPQPLHALEAQAAACMTHDVLNDLNKIATPTLVIGGREDIFTPPWMAKEVASSIPNAELHLLDHCGHAFHWEKITEFNPLVRNWLMKA